MPKPHSKRKCAFCGQPFSVIGCYMPDYVYKRGSKVFCSYKCMRAFDKKKSETVAEYNRI